MLLLATCEQRTSRLLFPCAGAFASFARQKKGIEKSTLQIATTIKGKIDYKYKILNHHNKIRILYRTDVNLCYTEVLFSRSLVTIFAINANIDCARFEKY